MKTPLLSRLRQRDRAELFAAACVGVCIFFLLLLSFAVILLVDNSPAREASIWKRALGGLSLAGVLLLASWFLGSTLGVAIVSPFLKRTVGKAVPASLVMREFGLATVDELVHVIRLHGLRVYRTEQRLGNEIVENMRCRLEPLFAKYSYVPYIRSHFFSENRLCFEKAQVDAAFDALQLFRLGMPEAMVNWGGQPKAGLREAVEKLKTDSEKKA